MFALQVAEMKAQVKEKEQRCQILADQLAASQKVIDAHSVNQPEFDARKAEHKALSVSIEGVRQVCLRDGSSPQYHALLGEHAICSG